MVGQESTLRLGKCPAFALQPDPHRCASRKRELGEVVYQAWDYPLPEQYTQAWEQQGLKSEVSNTEWMLEDVRYMSQLWNRPDYLVVFEALPTFVMKSDFWRYVKLYLCGGLYANADVLPSEELRQFVTGLDSKVEVVLMIENASLGMFERLKRDLGITTVARVPQYRQSFMIAKPGHPGFLHVLDRVVDTFSSGMWMKLHDPSRTLELTGSAMFTDVMQEYDDCESTLVLSRHVSSKLYSRNHMDSWAAQDAWSQAGDGVDFGAPIAADDDTTPPSRSRYLR